jgi:hypothetical protein
MTTTSGRMRGSRLRQRIDRIVRPTFTVALLGSLVIGTVLVLIQLVGAAAGAGGLVEGVASTLGPVAYVLAALACVLSLVLGYTRPQTEEADS